MKEIDKYVQIKSNSLKPAKGRLLISEPFMGDYYFGRSVVLLAEHNEEGSFGVVLNKSIQAPFNEVLKGLPDFNAKVFVGGPVDTNSLFYIHTLGEQLEDSLEIAKGLYWGGDIDILREMIQLNLLNPLNIRFFVGYSGWGSNQLETELRGNSWLVHKTVDRKILEYPINRMWEGMLNEMGPAYKFWSKFPIDPNMN